MPAPACRRAIVLAFVLVAGPPLAAQILRSPVIEGAQGSDLGAWDLAAADVDGDGHPDLVATTATETRLLLGTPEGPYGANLPFLGGLGLYACQLADLDGDGLDDVVRAPSPGNLLVQRNLGGGVFAPALTLPTMSPVPTLCLADLDDDGDLDVAAGLSGHTRIAIFLNDGAGGFDAGHNEIAPLSVRRITAGDVDGDGTLDLVVHNHRYGFGDDGQAALLRGTGGGNFADPVVVHADVTDAVVADFTADGLADIAVAEDHGSIVVHAGDARLSLPVAFSLTSLGPWPVLGAGDVDADGDADLLQAIGDKLGTHLQAPGGGLGDAILGTTSIITTTPLVLADLDRDGRLDAATVNTLLGRVTVTLGNGDGSWRLPAFNLSPSTGIQGTDAEIADLDGDGRADVVQSVAVAQPSLLHHGAVDGAFEAPQVLDLGADVLRVFANDSTQDGLMDLVVVRASPTFTPGGGVALAIGDGQLGFSVRSLVTPSSRIVDAEGADLNLDGRTDVLAVEPNKLQVFLNDGDGGFTSLPTLSFTSTPLDADAADVDHDGDVDLLLSFPGSGTATLRVFKQTAGIFSQASSVNMPDLHDLVLHDLDGDGQLDAVGAAQPASADGNLLVRHGAADGSFGALQTVPMPGARDVGVVSVAELDTDAEAELLVGSGTNSSDGSVRVFDLVGGVPVLAELHASGLETTRLVPADVNGDGRQDVFVVAGLRAYALTNTAGPWTRLAHPISGNAGDSLLAGEGTLQPGSPLRISIVGMQPLTSTLLVVGLGTLNAPFKGGVFVPTPTLLLPGLPTDALGDRTLTTTWPASLPSGLQLVMQAWQADDGAPAGFSSTNGLRGVAP